ncbi:hypothetical protein [Pararobbsia alpina]|uniref:Uncharacterized protein n=1 Tax=Pararobbsia alpina TaxID=621374 RepID=A0A6S7CAZ6_9BURK|nr:hypothetical protein [Pararobbsia alpina]CAB3785203.1 hypothetical protein LMG28138_01982 [Pararobbsia alpina]
MKQRACSAVLIVLALAGCAQLPAVTETKPEKPAPVPGEVLSFTIPPDALGAHDPQLSAVLAKAGSLAAAQQRPTTVRVTALAQDFKYLNQAIWRGVPAQRTSEVSLENLTAGMNESYSVSIKTTP